MIYLWWFWEKICDYLWLFGMICGEDFDDEENGDVIGCFEGVLWGGVGVVKFGVVWLGGGVCLVYGDGDEFDGYDCVVFGCGGVEVVCGWDDELCVGVFD